MKSLRPRRKRVRPLLGTFVSIELEAPVEAELLDRWISAGFEAVEEVDRLMSVHRADSDLSRLNRAVPGAWVTVSPLTRHVLQTALKLFQVSGGVFDIRCGTVPARGDAPLEFRSCEVRKMGNWSMDLGGIAKGFAVDQAVERIQRFAGTRVSGTVNAGGDLRIWGDHALSPAELRHTAAATSAVRAQTDTHLTPAVHRQMPSGRPLKWKKTVTVFAARCLWADALTKIVMLASRTVARECLAAFRARALIFDPHGRLQEVMG